MTKDQIIQYLTREKAYLSLSAIGKVCAVPNLSKIINKQADGRGYPFTLSDRHLPALNAWIKKHIKTS